MLYEVTLTDLPEVLVLEPKVFGDDRGFFFESYNQREFQQATGLDVTSFRTTTANPPTVFCAVCITKFSIRKESWFGLHKARCLMWL